MILDKEIKDEKILFNNDYENTIREKKIKLEKYKENIFYDEYTYIEEYLQKYEYYIKTLNMFGKNAIVLLAAAVSDYYIPDEKMIEHKIQSSGNNLNIYLYPVKKEL